MLQSAFRPFLLTVDGERENGIDFARLVCELAAGGSRKRFKVLTYASVVAWVKDVVKAKTKPKDGIAVVINEACTQAQGSLDAGEELTPELAARLLKLKMLAVRDEVLEAKAVDQKAREALEGKVQREMRSCYGSLC